MIVSNEELVNRFYDGYENGKSNNMHIAEYPGGATVVVGFGHAIYAYRRDGADFKPVVFTGWADASRSSARHISLLTSGDCIEAPGRAKSSDVHDSPSLDYLMQIADGDEDYGGFHSKQDRARGEQYG
jgi:hypothetical protein